MKKKVNNKKLFKFLDKYFDLSQKDEIKIFIAGIFILGFGFGFIIGVNLIRF